MIVVMVHEEKKSLSFSERRALLIAQQTPLPWLKCAARFSAVFKVAKDVLGILILSVASESKFMGIGKLIDPTRSALCGSSIMVLILLKSKLPVFSKHF